MKCSTCGCDQRMLCKRCREGRCTTCPAPASGYFKMRGR